MSRGVLRTLLAYELRMVLRDRRTILIAVVAPLVLFPAILLLMRAVERRDERRLEEATYAYAVQGTLADSAAAWVRDALALQAASRDSAAAEGDTAAAYRFEARTPGPEAVDSLLDEGELQLVVRALTREEAAAEAAQDTAAAAEPGDRAAEPDVPVLRLLYRSDSDLSRTAADRMTGALDALRTERRERLYAARGLAVDPDEVAVVEAENVASAEREGGAMIGLALTPLLLFLMLSGGSIVAADAIAGEKERGTLETLLTTAARRSEIVQAKMLSIIAVGVAVAVVNLLNMLVYLVIGVIDLPEGIALTPSPLALGLALLLLLPLTVLVASVLLLISGYAKSYKEYQLYFFPAIWVFVIPSLAGMLPGMELRSFISVVPIANVGVAVREIMIGEYDWAFLGVAFASTSLVAAWLARLAERTLSTERLITHAELDEAAFKGGPALFSRHVLGWFAVLWAVLFVTALWFGDSLGIRGQILVNVVGLFLGGSLLMLRRYRLPVREALALRPVKPLVWLAVLIGAPSALVVATGVGELAQVVFPVPEEMIEAFGQFILPPELPLWQVVLFLAVLPGICEEIAFRGVLLYGLRRWMRPVPLALATGVIFGLFHVDLFRIVPVSYMGVLLGAVTLLTGSIFPAMLWHAINNATALVSARMGVASGVEPTGDPLVYVAGAVGLAVAFWILWRERTPYPAPGGAPSTREAGGRRMAA